MKYGTELGKKTEFGIDRILRLEITREDSPNFGNILKLLLFFFVNEDSIYPKSRRFAGRTKLFNAIESLYNGRSIKEIVTRYDLPALWKPIKHEFIQNDKTIELKMIIEWEEKISIPGLFEILKKYFKTEDEAYFEAIKKLHDKMFIKDIVEYYQLPKPEPMTYVMGKDMLTEELPTNQPSLNKWF